MSDLIMGLPFYMFAMKINKNTFSFNLIPKINIFLIHTNIRLPLLELFSGNGVKYPSYLLFLKWLWSEKYVSGFKQRTMVDTFTEKTFALPSASL